jgi:PKD repeat protein
VFRYRQPTGIPGISRARGALACLAVSAVAAGCGSSDLVLPNSGDAASIRVVSGDGQRGSVGEPLTAPVVVEVTNGDEEPVAGVTVLFALTSAGAGAEVTPDTVRTNAAGRAQAHVLLGDKVGLQTGEARVMGAGGDPPSTTFVALAVSVTSGNGQPPAAAFTWDCDELACRFSDASTDDDGNVAGWLWRFGDGATSTEQNPSHQYETGGTYGVTLTVTDNDGGSDIATEQVTAAPAVPSNDPPQADFTVSCQQLTCSFADRSTDPDGRVASRTWDFGDGATSTEPNPSHTYATQGRYSVTLQATDNEGASDTRTRTAAPSAPTPEPNQAPEAEFEVSCRDLTCTFTDQSSDSDGTIAGRLWDFGDGATSTQRNPSRTYAAAGQYTVTLRVTDDDGAQGTRTRQASPSAPRPTPEPNEPPRAGFSFRCEELTCTFTDQSSDPDGSIASRQWDFGDGATSTERSPSHTYAESGTYNVRITVTDNDGATDAASNQVRPTAPPANRPPEAEFTVSCTELTCSFTDRSSDPDGSILSRTWDFGDGATSTEPNPSHTYAAAGSFTVVLTVTDDDGANDTASHQAEPAAPPAPPNHPPHADFRVHCEKATCEFSDTSRDDDGTVVSWVWDFGDGATSTEQNPVHSYAEPHRYDVRLTVTDDDGATSSSVHHADPKR